MTLKEFFSFSWLKHLFSKRAQEANDFELTESMWGYVSAVNPPLVSGEEVPDFGEEAYRSSYEEGKTQGLRLFFEVTLRVENFSEFIAPSGRRAPMAGTVTCENLFGERLSISDGEYGLYWVDPKTGGRRISYRFDFSDKDGIQYRFSGIKKIVHDEKTFDILEDQTTLFSVIRRLDGDNPIVSKGIIHYHVKDFPAMVLSIRTPSEDTLINRMRMTGRFFSFVNKEISEYFTPIKPYYRAAYNNLVISGKCLMGEDNKEFLLFSGVHDKGFPWGDNVGFTDIGLVIGEGGQWRRFVASAHAMPDLKMRLTEGTFRFSGTLFELVSGKQVSFSEMQGEHVSKNLKPVPVSISVMFDTKQMENKQIPFECDYDALKKYHGKDWQDLETFGASKELEKWREIPDVLGYSSEIMRVTTIQGGFDIDGRSYAIESAQSLGEAENGTISSLRKPPLYYNYFCAIEPESQLFRIFIRSGILRTLSDDELSTKVSSVLGNVVGQFIKKSITVTEKSVTPLEWDFARRLTTPIEEILEINNDHYPTAVFQRRVVVLPGLKGSRAPALEEDMSVLNLDASGTGRSATVAAIKKADRFEALDEAMTASGFFETIDKACSASGKEKRDFAVVVKSSFSFMYSLADRSTFTDPDLVEHLFDRLCEKGYQNLTLAEAKSTYSCFFTNRDVPTLARYVGYSARNYQIVDLSEDTVPHSFGKTLGDHRVHPKWRDADFRISFAKNKTHSYAFYTLTLKNIYGALPEADKFKAYHCDKNMGIYKPAIDYLEAFPVHFGFIDAYISADGAFGIFADKEPNFTETIIGGDDLAAVDWVGASKMGIDPMVSEYMKEAVRRFGKPKIVLIGDHSLYRNWRNVPDIISKAAHGLMDSNYLFGNFLYSVMGSMDPFFRFKQDEAGRRVGRLLTAPLRKVLFEWVTGDREELTLTHLQKMFNPEQLDYMDKLLKSIVKD